MQVRATKSFTSPQGRHSEGDTFTLPEGVDWVAAGLCEPVAEPQSPQKGGERDDLEQMTKSELYDLAAKADVDGRSQMSKAELISALL